MSYREVLREMNVYEIDLTEISNDQAAPPEIRQVAEVFLKFIANVREEIAVPAVQEMHNDTHS